MHMFSICCKCRWIKASAKWSQCFAKMSRFVQPVRTHQALALLAVLHPCVSAAVGEQAVLVQTLAAQARVTLWAAEQVGVGVVAVANHSAAHHLASLSRGAQTHQSGVCN